MKIDGNNPYLRPDYQTPKREAVVPPDVAKAEDPSGQRDRLELSIAGRELQELTYRAGESPEVRAERIAELRSRIEAGTYNIKAQEVAEAMITGGLIDRSV